MPRALLDHLADAEYEALRATCAPAAGNTIAIAEIAVARFVCTLNQLARGGSCGWSRRDRAIASFCQQIDQQQYHLLPVA